jgi:septal ring factor EnvC (AmiA/AmiB activator)
VAEQAAQLAASRHWEAQSALEELSKVVAAPSGALAADFIASVSAGNPCGTAVLERSAIDARAQIKAAENDVRVWEQTQDECERAVRAKEADVAAAKDRVERAARIIIANAETVKRLGDGLEALQAEVIEKRSALPRSLEGLLRAPQCRLSHYRRHIIRSGVRVLASVRLRVANNAEAYPPQEGAGGHDMAWWHAWRRELCGYAHSHDCGNGRGADG